MPARTPLWRRVFSLPRRVAGWWALGFMAALPFLLCVLVVLGVVLNVAGGDVADYPWTMIVVLFAAGASVLAGMVAALFAIIVQGERSILVFGILVPVLIAFLALLVRLM
jgi:hypothetical protein